MTSTLSDPRITRVTPTESLLTGSLLVAPVIYLAADATYAARGWDDAAAGVLHVLGAIAYGFLVMGMAFRTAAFPRLSVAILATGLVGFAGTVAYGFDTIHTSLGDIPLVDQPGAANLIKPLGLFFPLSLALVAVGLAKLGHRWQAVLVLGAAIVWPIAHIANIAALAVAVSVVLVVAFGSLAWPRTASASAS